MNFPLMRGRIGAVVTSPVMTDTSHMINIWGVSPRNPRLLTKRRAVDFCRVATAICRVEPGAVG